MKFDEHGRELPDPTPKAIPLGMERPEKLADIIARMVRTQLSQREYGEKESFQDASDFEMDDDSAEMKSTQYEEMTEEEPNVQQYEQANRSRGRDRRDSEGDDKSEGATRRRRRDQGRDEGGRDRGFRDDNRRAEDAEYDDRRRDRGDEEDQPSRSRRDRPSGVARQRTTRRDRYEDPRYDEDSDE